MLKRWRQTVTATDLVVWGIGLTIGIGVIYWLDSNHPRRSIHPGTMDQPDYRWLEAG